MDTVKVNQLTASNDSMRLRQAVSLLLNARERGARDAKTVSPNILYPVSAFIADQRRLLSKTRFGTTDFPETVDLIDGRLIIVHPALRLAPNVPDLCEPFTREYGREVESAYRFRFILVLKFLAAWQPELVKSALAQGHEPMAVREEFVSFLLKYELRAQQTEIPQGALRAFLDEWSHRWI